jgi:hypothetical protein
LYSIHTSKELYFVYSDIKELERIEEEEVVIYFELLFNNSLAVTGIPEKCSVRVVCPVVTT